MTIGVLPVRQEPASVALVRHRISAELSACSVTREGVEDVVLVASELVSNAVVHARAGDRALDVAWKVDENSVTVGVEDPSADRPVPRQADLRDTGGRGLAIVAAIAEEWGVRSVGHGKQVWARIPVTRTA